MPGNKARCSFCAAPLYRQSNVIRYTLYSPLVLRASQYDLKGNSSLEFPGPGDLANYSGTLHNGMPPARVTLPPDFVQRKAEGVRLLCRKVRFEFSRVVPKTAVHLHIHSFSARSPSSVYSLQKSGRLSTILCSEIGVSQLCMAVNANFQSTNASLQEWHVQYFAGPLSTSWQ